MRCQRETNDRKNHSVGLRMAEEDKKKKTSSRKFLVWLTWLVVAVLSMIVAVVVLAITKNLPDSMIDIIKTVLSYLFYVSMMYLGVNAGQKIGVAVSDAMSTKKEEEEAEK